MNEGGYRWSGLVGTPADPAPAAAPLKQGFEPGSFGCREALHVVSVRWDMWARHVCEHPAINANPKREPRSTRILCDIHALYQAIGREHL